MVAGVSLRLLDLIFSRLLSWLTRLSRASSSKDVELLVLRHNVAVLGRISPRPRLDWADRAVFAALIRRLPTSLRGHRLVTLTTGFALAPPAVSRKWTGPNHSGHPPLDDTMPRPKFHGAWDNLRAGSRVGGRAGGDGAASQAA